MCEPHVDPTTNGREKESCSNEKLLGEDCQAWFHSMYNHKLSQSLVENVSLYIAAMYLYHILGKGLLGPYIKLFFQW